LDAGNMLRIRRTPVSVLLSWRNGLGLVHCFMQPFLIRRSFLLILGIVIASAAAYYCVCGVWHNCYCQFAREDQRQVSGPSAGHSVLRHFALPGIG
jgi:hypothetical protein